MSVGSKKFSQSDNVVELHSNGVMDMQYNVVKAYDLVRSQSRRIDDELMNTRNGNVELNLVS